MQDKNEECQNSEDIFIDKQKATQQIENNNYEKFQTLDSIFDKKVGMGKYQYLLLGSISFSNFIEGIEGTLSGLYPGILKNEWELGDSQIELIGSFFYIGEFLGFTTSSILADNLGRKNTLLLNTIVMFITNIATYYIYDYYAFLIIRLIYGFLVGNVIPVTSLIIGEMIPSQYRGRGMIFIGIFLVLGKIYCLVMASFFMDTIQTGKWRQLTLISAFPVVILFFVVYFFCDESPKLLIMKQSYEKAFQIFNKMIKTNKQKQIKEFQEQKQQDLQNNSDLNIKYSEEEKLNINIKENDGPFKDNVEDSFYLNFQEKLQIIKQSKQLQFKEKGEKNKFWDKLKGFLKYNPSLTFKFCVLISIFVFLQHTFSFIGPFILHQEQKSLNDYLLIQTAPLPGFIILYLLVDHQKFNNDYLICGMYIAYFLVKLPVPIGTLLLMQSYSTIYRAIALSFMAGVAGITSPVIPFIVYYLFTLDTYFVFYFSIGLLVISIMTGLTIVNFISKQEQIDKCYEDETNQSIQDPNEYFNQNNLTN